MKQPIENLTLFYINKKPIDFYNIFNITLISFFIVLISYSLSFNQNLFNNTTNKYLSVIIMFELIFFDIIFIKNFIEDKKGASDYIGYNSNYIQFRLPEYNIPIFTSYYYLRKKENSILISCIQKIKLKPHYWISSNNMTTKTEISIIFTLNQGIKKIRLNIEHNEINDFIEKIEQFANTRNIQIQSFRTFTY